MIFSELYGAYYNAVAAVLAEAVERPVSDGDIRQIVEKYAFGESLLSIPEALKEERWSLLKADGTTPLENVPTMPLTLLQKRWLKALSLDPRIRLFGENVFAEATSDLDDVEPLFLPSDVIVFDKYADGDDFTDEAYIANFRLILDAIRHEYPLEVKLKNRTGRAVRRKLYPRKLEYSEKDDKFRLIGGSDRYGYTVNLGRVISCEKCAASFSVVEGKRNAERKRKVVFEVTDERKALERVLLHFAHFEKSAERIEADRYLVTVHYEKEDETEIVIRMLSFGPLVKVTAPQHFVDLIKRRLMDQMSCGL